METVVDMLENEEAKVEDRVISQPEKAADPVIYQLVRVDGNGRLVPATDDEVMVVEDLLQDDKIEDKIVPDTGQIVETNTNYGCDSNKVQLKGSGGLPQLGDLEVGAEKLNEPLDPAVDSEKVDGQNEERISLLAPNVGDGSIGPSGNPDGCSKISSGLYENGASTSATSFGLNPDFSLLRGEIRLDNLSVKELQETFKATFGRETSVKDKQWLKRRIFMGLTNSCDFSTASFVITDNRVVKEGKEEINTADHFVLVDCVVKSAREIHEIRSNCDENQIEIPSYANRTRIQSSANQNNSGSKDTDSEQRPAKRVRKPTRRYIEELSEVESRDCGAKIVSPVRHPACDQPSEKVCAKPGQNLGPDRGCLTRKDSLGGSGVQVPYVSRIRRSRPRENFMTLTKLQHSGVGMPIRLVKNNAVASREELDSGSQNNILKAGLSSKWLQEAPVAVFERCQPSTENRTLLERKVELKKTESYKDNSDDEVVTVPSVNGGMRRKHHRPWTLTEVVKLVEGVAKYGAGRWSEIKRLAFASYSYRTSVDLKDKWRNLLKAASLTDLPAGNGMHSSRKQGSVLIPAPILSRVRELADVQMHIPTSPSSSKFSGYSEMDRSVQETRSGFL